MESMAYSLDFRRKVLSIRKKEGLAIAEVAVRFDVGVASVTRWIKNIHRKPQGFRRRKIDLGRCARMFSIILMLTSLSEQSVWTLRRMRFFCPQEIACDL